MFREPVEKLQGKEKEEKKVGGEVSKFTDILTKLSFEYLYSYSKDIFSDFAENVVKAFTNVRKKDQLTTAATTFFRALRNV